MIDTHSHLYDEAFDGDREDVITRARNAGIYKVFLPNINAATIAPMLSLCHAHPVFCHPMLGLHPEDVRPDWQQVLDDMESLLQDPGHPYIAIGEVGLDFYWDDTYREEQIAAFARQVQWATTYGLPLMVHTRNAHREVVDTIDSNTPPHSTAHNTATPGATTHDGATAPTPTGGAALCGVFHCFGGTEEEASELLANEGFMLGIGGVVTYKKSRLPDVLRAAVPLTRIVLETDSPYLAPVPHRGKRNESAHLTHVAAALANVYGCTPPEVARITTQNAQKVFKKAFVTPLFEPKSTKNA